MVESTADMQASQDRNLIQQRSEWAENLKKINNLLVDPVLDWGTIAFGCKLF